MNGFDATCLFYATVFSVSLASNIFSRSERVAAGCFLLTTVATWIYWG